jgi:DNA-binding response OmpR family regulator
MNISEKRRILVVEDEEVVRRFIGMTIRGDEIEVDEACNGKEALEKIFANKYDLIILDIMLPEIDGFQVLEKIRANPSLADLPVVIVSAKNSDKDILTGLKGGANYYITKPFEPQELISSLELILGIPRGVIKMKR